MGQISRKYCNMKLLLHIFIITYYCATVIFSETEFNYEQYNDAENDTCHLMKKTFNFTNSGFPPLSVSNEDECISICGLLTCTWSTYDSKSKTCNVTNEAADKPSIDCDQYISNEQACIPKCNDGMICQDIIQDFQSNTASFEECRDFCQLSDSCNYFSWGKQSRVCLAFATCDDRIDGQEDFITGSRECANEEFSDTSFFQRFSRKIRIGWHIFASKMKKMFHK